MVNSGFIEDSELVIYINESLAELYDLLIAKFGEDYYTKPVPYSIQVNGDSQQYNLPSDFYKARGVDLNLGFNNSISLKTFMFSERNKYNNAHAFSWNTSGADSARYRIVGRKIWFMPAPSGLNQIDIYYIPLAPLLESDSDTFDCINGWEQYLIVDTAIKMLGKEESDPSLLILEKTKLEKRINTMARNRDSGRSQRVSDVSSAESNYLDGAF